MAKVIVVGGGPVGLWTACELALAGIEVIVLERRAERIDQSRALSMHGRSLEILGLRGIADRFLKFGVKVPTGHFGVIDTRLDFTVIDSSFACSLFIAQRKTEELIEERAIELGVDVRRNAKVDRVDDLGDRVRVEYIVDGQRSAEEADYLVGADGARSIVRAQANFDFPGTPASYTGFIGDVIFGKPLSAPVISRVNDRGTIMIAPLGDAKYHRIVIFHSELYRKPRTEPVTMDELVYATTDILKEDYALSDPLWLSRFDNETRLVTEYRRGRILLAGDAAHIHLPAGGQGMNVGIADAQNLGWKLAMVAKGEAPDALLDTYAEERRPVGEYLQDNTLAQSLLITGFSQEALALRATLTELLKVPEANLHLAKQISGFGFSYPKALTTGEDEAQWRVADRHLTLADGTETSIFDGLKDGKWVHVAIEGEAEARLPDWLDRGLVTFFTASRVEGGLFGATAILVRPDGRAAYTNRAA